jgi:DNA-binding transcriptional LysR family regulator
MDRLELMEIVLAAVDAGSFSAAARKLDLPLATVSRKIAALEKHLHTRLFTRASRRIALTDAGSDYVLACRRIVEQVRDIERSAAGEYSAPKGELWVTAPLVFGRLHVLPELAEFLEAYPQIDVRLTLTDRVVNLQEDSVDLALRIGELPDSSLIATRLGSIHRVTCASPHYLKRRGTPKDPHALTGHDCITFEGLSASNVWTFDSPEAKKTVRVHSRLIVNTAEAAIDAAIAGAGITRSLSYQIAIPVAAGKLQTVLKPYDSQALPVSFVYRGGTLLPQKLKVFLEFISPRLRKVLG